jgi:hypothetical protein
MHHEYRDIVIAVVVGSNRCAEFATWFIPRYTVSRVVSVDRLNENRTLSRRIDDILIDQGLESCQLCYA